MITDGVLLATGQTKARKFVVVQTSYIHTRYHIQIFPWKGDFVW